MSDVSGRLQVQAWMVDPATQKVMRALLEDSGDARFVGGCVRDALVNRAVMDIDIATPLKPQEVIARLKRRKIPYALTGLKHGTVTAIADGRPFEITTLRLDVATFGRHADVQYTDDWQADAARRDFTINAMSATIDGNIFDPFGGTEDLRLGRVRFVGDPHQRIREDVLRILRFFRFYAHFGRGEPDAAALQACTAAASQVTKLSGERIRQEVLKLLDSDTCAAVWRLMTACGIVAHFLPEAANVAALENMVRLEAALNSDSFALRRLAAVLDATDRVAQALKLSNAQAAELAGMNVAVKIKDAADVKSLVYRLGNPMTRNLLLLHAARSGDEENLAAFYRCATVFRPPRFPLVGEDVLKLGHPPGPDVGRALAFVEAWWIGHDFVPERSECLKILQDKFRLSAPRS